MNPEQIIGECKAALADVSAKGQIAQTARLERIREPLLSLRVERYKALVKAREQYRLPNYKEKDGPKLTDLDRRTMMAAHTADVEADYELVAGLEKLVAERVELIKILLEMK